MESNGKLVGRDGEKLDYQTGAINFGEPGTNSQHSFFQLLHQGRTVPVEFIGYCKSQQPVKLYPEQYPIPNHEELMSNFFSQPDALALGKSADELRAANVEESLIPHKTFPGDRPSLSLLFDELTPKTLGYLLAIYEHRVAVEGFILGINSFDQMGVELGKQLAGNIRKHLTESSGKNGDEVDLTKWGVNSSTMSQLKFFLGKREK